MANAEKTLSWILKGGLLLTPFLVFVVTRSLYFPFITGKNFAFRMLTEALAVVWVYAALRFPRFRPRSSPLAWALVALVAVMGLATVFSLSPYRSFWSNFERMEGYIGLLHLFLYFLLLASVFRTGRDWSVFFHTSIAASVIISLYAVLQLAGWLTIHQGGTRVDATLGNATYLAAYLLFHLFFLVWFFLTTSSRWRRAAYGAAFFLELVILYYTATRGAMLGFLGGLALLAFLLAVLERGAIRKFALAGLGVMILVPIGFFLFRNAAFVRESDVLSRFASISPTETTTQARFTIWKMAIHGWRERPVFGWGQENFVFIFSKYYAPSLWRQEPWFDRAHNVFLDWLTAGGVLGLGAYLSIYGAAGWLIFRAFRKGALDARSASVVAALLAGHFFQNLFVFDNLTSWMLFFAVIAYVQAVSLGNTGLSAAASRGRRRGAAGGMMPWIPPALTAGVGAAFLLTLYYANVKPILTAKSILGALRIERTHAPAGRVDALVAEFSEAIGRNTFGTAEAREQISQQAESILRDQAIAVQDKQKYFELAIRELESQRETFPSDMRAKAFLATLYSNAGQPAKAVEVVNEALAVSDRRPQFYFIAGEAYLNANDPEAALQALRRAYELAPDYPEAAKNLATGLILAGRVAEAEAFFAERFGGRVLGDERYALAYTQINRFDKAAEVWQALVASRPEDPRLHAALGVAYARSGRPAEGIREVERAIELEPGFRQQGEAIIQDIRAGRVR